MIVNGIGASGYPAWYRMGRAGQKEPGTDFAARMNRTCETQDKERQQASGVRQPLVLHGKKDADEGETAVGSSVNARTGVSIAVYKPQDFDEANPAYHVRTWDAEGNMTERVVNISEVDPKNCDEVEMSAYTWYLSNSGKCPNAFLSFAGARAYNQTSRKDYTEESPFEKTDWADIIRDFMRMQYEAGNRKGFLDYKKLLGFLE